MTTILLPCIVQLNYNDNLLETIVNLLDFYSLILWRILSGGLGWSCHIVIYCFLFFYPPITEKELKKLLQGRRSVI